MTGLYLEPLLSVFCSRGIILMFALFSFHCGWLSRFVFIGDCDYRIKIDR